MRPGDLALFLLNTLKEAGFKFQKRNVHGALLIIPVLFLLHIYFYGCDIWTVDYRLKETLLSTELIFWRIAARTAKILKVKTLKNEVFWRHKGSGTNSSGKSEINLLKWY
jgi:hypothetical protein